MGVKTAHKMLQQPIVVHHCVVFERGLILRAAAALYDSGDHWQQIIRT